MTDFDNLIPHMKRAGFIATVLAAAITSMFGYQLGENLIARLALAGLLGLCTFIVGYALVTAYHAYKRGMTGVCAAAVGLFAIAAVCEFIAHAGFTASNKDATITQARFAQTLTENNFGAVDQASKDVERLQARLKMVPVRNVEQAQAAIDAAMADRQWDATDGCRRITGPKSRTFCSSYASAVADKAGAVEAKTIREELKQAQAAYADATAKASVSRVTHSGAASQGLMIASMMTASVRPDAGAIYWAGIGLSSLLALFAMAASGLLNFIAWSFDPKQIRDAIAEALATNTVIVDRSKTMVLHNGTWTAATT